MTGLLNSFEYFLLISMILRCIFWIELDPSSSEVALAYLLRDIEPEPTVFEKGDIILLLKYVLSSFAAGEFNISYI